LRKIFAGLWAYNKIIRVPGLEDYEVTDAHIGGWVRFVAPGRVVLNDSGPDRHLSTDVYDTTKKILSLATNAKWRDFEIVDLPEAGIERLEPIHPELC
jgi:agmatine deiminase